MQKGIKTQNILVDYELMNLDAKPHSLFFPLDLALFES
jgi:hypothetical protein